MAISQREAAWVRVKADGSAILSQSAGSGWNTLVHVAAGSYTIKSDRAWDVANSWVSCTVKGGAGNANAQWTSADGINWTITTFVGAVATDEIFDLYVEPAIT